MKCDELRCFYGSTISVLLVSRVYICDRRHQIIAYDPTILSLVKGILPCQLHTLVASHANVGLSISEIQSLWLQTMYDAYGSRREAYISECSKHSKSNASFPEFEQ